MTIGCGDDDDDDDSSGDDDDISDDDDDNDDNDDDNDDDDNDNDDDDDNDDDTTILDCPAVITRQPYLQLLTQTSVNIMWRTDEQGDSLVEWGETAALGRFVNNDTLRYRHELVIDELDPGTKYFYKVRSCLDETTIASFTTSPDDGEPFKFVAFGDSQENFEIFGQIADLMKAEQPQLAISVGDTVKDGWNIDDWDEQVFEPAEDLWREAPLYVAIGNHEGLSPFFFDSFHFPNNDKPYYSFVYGNVFFLALAEDTVHLTLPGTPQYKFIVDALSSDEAQNADFRVVFFHTPPWTEGWVGYDGEVLVRAVIIPVLEQYGVDVYFNGHTHDFERGLRNGVTNYIIGGAGGGLDSWARDVPHITVYNAVHHFVSISVTGTTMTLDAIDIDGNIFDNWQIVH